MIQKAKKHLFTTLKESFVPVMLVVLALGAVLVYVNFKAVMNADQVVAIQILDTVSASGFEDMEGVAEDDVTQLSDASTANPLHQQASQAVEKQQLHEAEKLYRQLVDQQASSQARNDLGVVLYRQGKLQEAFEQYSLAVNTEPVFVNVFMNRGLLYAKRGDYKEAIADYSRVINRVPHHFQAHFNLGVAYIKLQDHGNAVLALEKAVTQAGGQRKAKALYNLGTAYLSSGAPFRDKAEKAFTAAVRIKPDYIEARLALSDIASKTELGRAQALEEIAKVLELKPNYPPAYFRLAQIKAKSGDNNAAKTNYIQAVQHNPQYTKARYNLGLLYLDEKRWADARAQFEWIRAQEPNNATVHFQLGRAAYGEKDYATALSEYQAALELRGGKYRKALLNIGNVYKAQDKNDLAIAAYKNLLKLDSQYPEAWYNLGLAYMRIDQTGEAEDALLAAVKFDPKYSHAWFNLGVLYADTEQNDKAINAYQKALQINPEYQKAQLNLAVRHARKNQYGKAIDLYKAVLARDPNYASAWLNLGIAYTKQKQNNEAEKALHKALELEPDSVRARRFLAEIYISKGENVRAVQALQEALDAEPDNTSLRLLLSKAYRSMGKNREARTELEKALKLEPGNEAIQQELKNMMVLG